MKQTKLMVMAMMALVALMAVNCASKKDLQELPE